MYEWGALQRHAALRDRRCTLAAQLSEAHHLSAWHAGVTQADHQVDPGDIVNLVSI
jgi:hypothetical protein